MTIQDSAIREAIKQYTVDGTMGHLLDAEEDGLALSDFTVFEIDELMNLGEKYALPTLLYLFRRIERSLKGQPAVIILDEAWLMLGHTEFRDKIREWLKTLRKANCLVLMATQTFLMPPTQGSWMSLSNRRPPRSSCPIFTHGMRAPRRSITVWG